MSSNLYDPIALGPITVTFTVLSEDSNGSATVSRCDVEAGAGLPVPHFHNEFEETLYGLEGTTTLTVDGEDIELGPGDTYCIKRGAVHTFEARGGATSFLAVATPGLFGPDYFLELQEAVMAGGDGPPDPEVFGRIMLKHGLTPVPPGA